MGYISLDEAIRKMEHYCAYQERSHYQVENKLRQMGMIPKTVDYILLHLIKEGFLNEERFARAYVRGKFYQNKWGKIKIIHGLKHHKIHPKLIEKALTEIDPLDYQQTLKALITKKQKEWTDKSIPLKKQKIIQYLSQKGYSFSDIYNNLTP